ncbi:hypothetical protein V8F33_007382, partial [Rhypophila sp. PSN 637]
MPRWLVCWIWLASCFVESGRPFERHSSGWLSFCIQLTCMWLGVSLSWTMRLMDGFRDMVDEEMLCTSDDVKENEGSQELGFNWKRI